jgi:hypothetical protein
VADSVVVMVSCTVTVTQCGKLILRLTHCAFTGRVGEGKSVILLQEQSEKPGNGLTVTWNMAGWECKLTVD